MPVEQPLGVISDPLEFHCFSDNLAEPHVIHLNDVSAIVKNIGILWIIRVFYFDQRSRKDSKSVINTLVEGRRNATD